MRTVKDMGVHFGWIRVLARVQHLSFHYQESAIVKLLIIDDEKLFRWSIVKTLTRAGTRRWKAEPSRKPSSASSTRNPTSCFWISIFPTAMGSTF